MGKLNVIVGTRSRCAIDTQVSEHIGAIHPRHSAGADSDVVTTSNDFAALEIGVGRWTAAVDGNRRSIGLHDTPIHVSTGIAVCATRSGACWDISNVCKAIDRLVMIPAAIRVQAARTDERHHWLARRSLP